ncbi:MAG: hypothetical protein WA086_12970 [Ideonella sp.]
MSERALARGRRHLLDAAAAGFPEACHRMTFPRAAGFSGPREQQEGSVFSRAILGCLLLDLAEALGGDDELRAAAVAQAHHVASQRRPDLAGGWRYFPGLPELPPDLDTLAAATDLFARIAPRYLPLTTGPIALALAQRGADGTIPTFLISPEDPPEQRATMQRGVALYWGNTADADVLARFYRALLRLDPVAHGPLAPLDWLAGQQAADGSWLIPWYTGQHYGTRLCADLFEALAPNAPAAVAARAFLSRPLPGSGALDLAMTAPTPALSEALIQLQRDDGSWPAEPWLQMPMGRPSGQVVRTLTWQSQTLSTAYCLRALAQGLR